MRRVMHAVLGMFLAVSAGCTGSGKSTTPTEITIWHYYNNAQLESFQGVVDTFNETVGQEENIVVSEKTLGYVTDLANGLIESAKEMPGSDSMPDMFMAYSDTVYVLDQMGVVADLDSYYSKEELSAFYPGFLKDGYFGDDQKLKSIPVAKSMEALYLNETDWNKFVEENPQVSLSDLSTIEGIIKVSELYYNWSGGKSFYGRDSLSNYFVIGARQLGIDLFTFDQDGNFVFNADENVMRKLFDCYYVPLVKGYFSADGKFRSSDMQTGDVLCYTGSTSSSFYFPETVIISDSEEYDIDCLVMEPPAFEDAEKNYVVSQGAGFSVTKGDEQKEKACVTFLKWLNKGDNFAEFSSGAGYLPVIKEQLTPAIYENVTHEAERQSFEVELEMLDQNPMYTNTPSDYGTAIRALLDQSLNQLAVTNQEEIAKDEKNGMSHEDAINKYTNDETFQNWLNGLLGEVNQLTK